MNKEKFISKHEKIKKYFLIPLCIVFAICLIIFSAFLIHIALKEPTINNSQQTTNHIEISTTETIVPSTENVETTTENRDFDIKLTFVGDVMLAAYLDNTYDGNFNDFANKKAPSYFLEKVKPIFEEDDFTIVNLENVFSDSEVYPVKKDHNPAYWFKSKTSNIDILTSSSVECVSLANNHIGDYGTTGRQDTIDTVANANLFYGTYENTMYIEKNGFKIAIICTGLWGEWATDGIINRIKEEEGKTDYQIVFFHGGQERLHEPEEWKVNSVHKMVDNGADLIIGGHPHVLQPKETYNDVEIVYSLGNFCYGGHTHPENRTIIYQIELIIDEQLNVKNKKSEIIPCYVYTGSQNNFQPAIIKDNKEKQKVIDFMNKKAELPY